MTAAVYYLIGVNAASFVLIFINTLLHRRTQRGQIDAPVALATALGGAAGTVLGFAVFDRKPQKETMLVRVVAVCALVIQVLAALLIWRRPQAWQWNFIAFFAARPWLIAYLAGVNLLTFIAFAVDKAKAAARRSRIRIVWLLALAFAGGSVGGLLGMYLLRHKTRKDYFTLGLPLMLLTQVLAVFFAMNI